MALTKHEFYELVEMMRRNKVPLTMPNLMVRTELPRHVIQEWLDDMHDEQMIKAKKEKPSLATLLALVHVPLGTWIHRVYTDEQDWRVERAVYRVVGVDPRTEQR